MQTGALTHFRMLLSREGSQFSVDFVFTRHVLQFDNVTTSMQPEADQQG